MFSEMVSSPLNEQIPKAMKLTLTVMLNEYNTHLEELHTGWEGRSDELIRDLTDMPGDVSSFLELMRK